MGSSDPEGADSQASLAQDGAAAHHPPCPSDHDIVAALDVAYQAAVKCNDAETMDRILHPQYALVLGDGRVIAREKLLQDARSAFYTFQIQDELPDTQTVRVWGDTAAVTALLRIKGESSEGSFDRTLWFSDTYVRTASGWRYAFAQASLPLPTL